MPYKIEKRGGQFCVVKETTGKAVGCHDTRTEANAQLAALYARGAAMLRYLKSEVTTYEVREETFDGRAHLVVPVVALVEGVIQAMNAPHPEFVAAEEFSRPGVVGGFNGRPIYEGHPVTDDGEPISGNTPELLEAKCIGHVFHAAIKKGKLTMEAWIDIEKAEQVAPKTLERAQGGQPIEISVGVYCDTDELETGDHNGLEYAGAWHDIVPDHLALLPPGDRGACSNAMGCGVRAAKQEGQMTDEELYAEFRTLRNIPQEERDKMPASDFAGPGRSFPIAKPEDVAAAASSLGRAKGNTSAIKRKIIAIAYRKGSSFVAKLPEEWKKKKDQKNASFFARVMNAFRAEQATEEMSDNDIRRHLMEALREADKTTSYVEAYYPNATPPVVVYSCYCGAEYPAATSSFYQREYSVGENGKITLGAEITEVEPILTYQPVPADEPVAPTAAQGAPCRCKDKDTRSAIDMTKEQIAKFLETATDDQVKALSAVVEPPAAATTEPEKKTEQAAAPAAVTPAAPAAEVQVEQPVVAAAPKTFEELLATAEPSVRDAINEGKRIGSEKRAATIKALKETGRCDMSDKELEGKSQAELDQLVKLAGAPKVDFSAAGASRPQEQAQEVPAAPDLVGAVKAARAKK